MFLITTEYVLQSITAMLLIIAVSACNRLSVQTLLCPKTD